MKLIELAVRRPVAVLSVVLLAMLIFGGEVIRGFSWILTIGVISGAYSTLWILPAVAVGWENWKASRRPSPAGASARIDAATPAQTAAASRRNSR